MTARTRIYCLRATSGHVSLIRASTPAAAIRHWAESLLSAVGVASQDDIVEAVGNGVTVETAGDTAEDDQMADVAGAIRALDEPVPPRFAHGSLGEYLPSATAREA